MRKRLDLLLLGAAWDATRAERATPAATRHPLKESLCPEALSCVLLLLDPRRRPVLRWLQAHQIKRLLLPSSCAGCRQRW